VVLPLVVWGIETYGPKGVSALQGGGPQPTTFVAGPPVTVVVQGQDTGDGANFVFPRGQSLSAGPAAGCTNFLRWAHDKGGFLEADSESLLIIVQGKTAQQAVIESLRTRILSRQPLPTGVVIQGCQQGKGSIITHDLHFDLDRLTPAFFPGEEKFQAYSVSSTDSDVFTLYAYSQRYAYKWVVEMKVVQNGHIFTIDIPAPDGQPFATTPQCLKPQYFFTDDGRWLPGPPSDQPWSSSQLCPMPTP
jgi:hypothetical protein